jgi:hypothetical protein
MAAVASIKGRVIRLDGEAHQGWLPGGAVTAKPFPAREVLLDLEIIDDGGGHFLLVYSSPNADFSGDTWHEKLEDAFDQAESTFGIARDEWRCK